MVDVISTPRDEVTREELALHPLVRHELEVELNKWTKALEECPADRLAHIQSKVAILKWILFRMTEEILTKEDVKRKLREAAEKKLAHG